MGSGQQCVSCPFFRPIICFLFLYISIFIIVCCRCCLALLSCFLIPVQYISFFNSQILTGDTRVKSRRIHPWLSLLRCMNSSPKTYSKTNRKIWTSQKNTLYFLSHRNHDAEGVSTQKNDEIILYMEEKSQALTHKRGEENQKKADTVRSTDNSRYACMQPGDSIVYPCLIMPVEENLLLHIHEQKKK